jgi:hypothetical protein
MLVTKKLGLCLNLSDHFFFLFTKDGRWVAKKFNELRGNGRGDQMSLYRCAHFHLTFFISFTHVSFTPHSFPLQPSHFDTLIHTPHTSYTPTHTHNRHLTQTRRRWKKKRKKKGIWPKRANEEYNFLLYFVRTQFLFLFFLIICFEIMIICV